MLQIGGGGSGVEGRLQLPRGRSGVLLVTLACDDAAGHDEKDLEILKI